MDTRFRPLEKNGLWPGDEPASWQMAATASDKSGHLAWFGRDYCEDIDCRAIGCLFNIDSKCATPSHCIITTDGKCHGFTAKPAKKKMEGIKWPKPTQQL